MNSHLLCQKQKHSVLFSNCNSGWGEGHCTVNHGIEEEGQGDQHDKVEEAAMIL